MKKEGVTGVFVRNFFWYWSGVMNSAAESIDRVDLYIVHKYH